MWTSRLIFCVADDVEDVARAVDGDLDELLPRAPVADAGGGMVDAVDALHRPCQGVLVGHVAVGEFDALGLEPGGVAAAADEGADGPAALDELFDNVTAEKSCCAGYEIHVVIPVQQ